jgi:hypothetical protein
VRISEAGSPFDDGGMKTSRSLVGPTAVYLGTALAFLTLDLYGLSFANWDWAPFSAVLAQILGLTLVVGTWISAMIFFEKEDDELASKRASPAAARQGALGM